jgi:hypothetical protein
MKLFLNLHEQYNFLQFTQIKIYVQKLLRYRSIDFAWVEVGELKTNKLK